MNIKPNYIKTTVTLVAITVLPMPLIAELPSGKLPLLAVAAPEWEDAFTRTSGAGWYSGDGLFSIPLNGDDSPGSARSTRTFWLFSDTHACITDINSDGSIPAGADRMMNHSVAVMEPIDGSGADWSDMNYIFGDQNNGKTYGNIFEEKMWALDGLNLDGKIYMFMLNKGEKRGVTRVTIPVVDEGIDLYQYTKEAAPLYSETTESSRCDPARSRFRSSVRLASAILDNSPLGGASVERSDGYVYVYGSRIPPKGHRQLVVGRVLKKDFANFDKWRYWDGSNWQVDFGVLDDDRAVLAPNIGNRISVTPVNEGPYKGKYILIYMRKQSNPILEYSIGESPVGPFAEGVPFWYPEEEIDTYGADIANFYNAKAHPHLSNPGELLVSYCLNVQQPVNKTNDKNRGRFVRLKLDEFAKTTPIIPLSLGQRVFDSSGCVTLTSDSCEPDFGKFDADNVAGSPFKDDRKWIDNSIGAKWVTYDMEHTVIVSRWRVVHNGFVNPDGGDLNTRDFELQKSDDSESWVTVDGVQGNTEDSTDRKIEETAGRYWRLFITNPSQGDADVANVYDFSLFGRIRSSGMKTVASDG